MKLATAVCIVTFANAVLGAPTKPHSSKDVGASDTHGPWKPAPNGYSPSADSEHHGRPSGAGRPSAGFGGKSPGFGGRPSAGFGVYPTAATAVPTPIAGKPSGKPSNSMDASNGVGGSSTSTPVAAASTPAGGVSTTPAVGESTPAAADSMSAGSNSASATVKPFITISGYPATTIATIATTAQSSNAGSVGISASPTPPASQGVGGGKPSGYQPFASGGYFKPSGVAYGTGVKPRPTGYAGQKGGGKGKNGEGHASNRPDKSGGFSGSGQEGHGGKGGKGHGQGQGQGGKNNSTIGWWI